jgi:DNA-binding winged helix-turn-helix (wHTH) protein
MSEKRVLFGKFALDFGRFQLYRGEYPVRLEGLPLQLLMLLIENRPRLVTRERIAEELWGEGVFVDVEQGINTAIRKIRLALEDNYSQPHCLQTVVGRGYRFVAETSPDGEAQVVSPAEEPVMFSAEELGRAIMAAAGLDPNDLDGSSKT